MSDQNVTSQETGFLDISELINPFPGLRPFGIEESHLFFGREGQSDEVLVKLAENKFVAILGASGSGKSSLMYCGLIPTLYGGFMTDAGSNWKIIVTRPGGGPIDNLAEALLTKNSDYNQLGEEDKLIKKTITGTVLRSSSLGLIEAVKQLKTSNKQNFLILVDQFEELFRYKRVEALESEIDESSAFVNLLLEAIHQYDEPIYVALTMRSDFIGECALFPDLTQMINDSHYLIPQMTRDQKRLAIEGPVAVGGGKIAGRLTQQLLNDVGDNPDQLPILQHALMRTWQYWVENRKEGEDMDVRHYNAIGTLQEALSQHANEAYDSLSKREKEICEVMFKALTERGAENQGIRRPTKLSTIASIVGVSEDEVTRVVEKFREPGRSLLMPPYGVRLESDTVIDISHESLMRIWVRLRRWLDEESKSAEMYLKLSESAERYQEGKAGLWQMPDLQLALNWEEENKPTLVWGQRYNMAFERTMVFLETSKKAYETEQRNKELLQKRQVKRTRNVAIILSIATLVSIFLVIFAQLQSAEANKLRADAERQKLQAENLKENAIREAAKATQAQAQAVLEKEKADKALLKAQEQEQLAIQAGQRAEAQRIQAEANAREAKEQQAKATKAAEDAKLAELESQRQARLAQQQKLAADRLRYQAIAQSMAIKAKNVSQPELKALVARQAYLFWKEYRDEGDEFNGDIYAGIYYALKGLKSDSLNHLKGHDDAVRSVVFDEDGSRMYSAGSDGMILTWNMDNESNSVLFQNDNVSRVVGVSPDERYLALGSDKDNIFLFDLKNQSQEPKEIIGHGGAVFDLIFMPDNSGFISVGSDKIIRRSDYNSSEAIITTESRVKALAVSPNGKILAGGAENGDVYLWDLEAGNAMTTIYTKSSTPVNAITFNKEGNKLAFGDYDGNIILWDLAEGKKFGPTLTGFQGPVLDLKFGPNNKLLGGASADKTARLWNIDPEHIFDLPTVLDDHNDWVFTLDFHPSGEYLVTGSKDQIIRKWPVYPSEMSSEICGFLTRNMSQSEWFQYVGKDIDERSTCEGLEKGTDN